MRLRALALKAIAERDALTQERDVLIAERDKLQCLYEHVHHLLRKANDARFGASSEQLAKLAPDQLRLALEDLERASPGTKRSRRRNSSLRHAYALPGSAHRCRNICRASMSFCERRADQLPVLQDTDAYHRRRHVRAAGRGPGAIPCNCHAPAEACLPVL